MSIWLRIMYVFLAGGFGSACRYLVQIGVAKLPDSWMGLSTLIVNSLGCFIIGMAAGLLVNLNWSATSKETWVLLIMTGFCGGFSTFSAFTLDCVKYFESDRMLIWLAFAAATMVFGFGLCILGYYWGQKI